MMNKLLILILALFLNLLGRAELATVPNVDLDRYLGTWEEIARFENKHQQGCENSRAQYTKNGELIEIKNSCMLPDGKLKEVSGRAKVGDEKDNARLKVNFTPFFIRMFGVGWGNYYIIELGKDYEYSVVSEPNKQYLWILSRHKPMSKELFDKINTRLLQLGFDMSKLIINKNAVLG